MNKTIIIFILLILLNLSTFAQSIENNYDLSGTWILDEEKTSFDKQQREDFSDYKLVIEDDGNTLIIKESYIWRNDKYYRELTLNDNKIGEKNSYFKNGEKIKEVESESYRKKNTIYRIYVAEQPFGEKLKIKYKVTQKYILSKKKDKITLKTKRVVISTSDRQLSQVLSGTLININSKQKYIFRKQE